MLPRRYVQSPKHAIWGTLSASATMGVKLGQAKDYLLIECTCCPFQKHMPLGQFVRSNQAPVVDVSATRTLGVQLFHDRKNISTFVGA